MLFVLLFSYSNAQNNKEYLRKEYTFQEIGFAKEDIKLTGVNPVYDIFIPVYPNFLEAILTLNIRTPDYLRKDSSITVYVDDVPVYNINNASGINEKVSLRMVGRGRKNFVKVSIRGNLRISNNICDDIFSDRLYMIISKTSTISFTYEEPKDIYVFLKDYSNTFCIDNIKLIPLAYYLSVINPIKQNFLWSPSSNCKHIKLGDKTYLQGNVLYISEKDLKAITNRQDSLLFGREINVIQSKEDKEGLGREISLRDMGFTTTTVKGIANLTVSIPFDTGRFSGMPDKLYLRLKFANSYPYEVDNLSLRIFLNNSLIKAMNLEDGGIKSIDVEIPTNLLSYGYNKLDINLANFVASNNCFGAITHSILTIYDDSYFYWNAVKKEPKTISDFIKLLNGDVLIVLEDHGLIPVALNLLNGIAEINKNVRKIDISQEEKDGYDFVLKFKKPKWEKGTFEVYNPLTEEVIFSAKYSKPFIFVSLGERPRQLEITYYGNPNITHIAQSYKIEDWMNLFGNIGIFTEDYPISFEVGKKLRIRHEFEKSLSYYWNLYKLWIIILLGAFVFAFLVYVYKRLTRRPA